jgi:hypothetical protein
LRKKLLKILFNFGFFETPRKGLLPLLFGAWAIKSDEGGVKTSQELHHGSSSRIEGERLNSGLDAMESGCR